MSNLDDEDLSPLLPELAARIDGEVHADSVTRMLYAADASPYQELPLAAVRPRHAADCAAIVRFAARHRIPLIPRAAGTSLAGQCVGSGLVVDVSRHLTEILEIDCEGRRVRVQPGVILEDLNDALAPNGLMFGPDTSTANRCMIGGMIGNNACGSHSILYGTTRDHVLEVA
ncbi:MAG: FAD-binding oxidoreductase, partial [Gammaproteobacteria bacterium]